MSSIAPFNTRLDWDHKLVLRITDRLDANAFEEARTKMTEPLGVGDRL